MTSEPKAISLVLVMKAPASTFIREPGRAKSISLETEVRADVLKNLFPADILNFKIKGGDIYIADTEGNLLGRIEDSKISDKVRTCLETESGIIAILLGRERKTLEILIKTDLNMFPEDDGDEDYHPFSHEEENEETEKTAETEVTDERETITADEDKVREEEETI